MTSTTTERLATQEQTALFTMIEHQSFLARLVEELRLAVRDFTTDPRGFARGIFTNETRDSERLRRLRLGLVSALVVQLLLSGFIVIISRHTTIIEKRGEDPEYRFHMLPLTPAKPPKVKAQLNPVNPKATLPPIPDVVPKGNPDKGGGGGGQNGVQEPKAGQPPQTLPIPSVVAPDSQPAMNPSMPAPANLQGPESAPPPPDTTIGSNGKTNNPGAEAGTKNGRGGGNGPGNGSGDGSGIGPGKNGGKGDGIGGSLDGVPTGPIDYGKLGQLQGNTGIVFIHRVRPIVTHEAQENKVYGYVFIEATFNADGTITDIVVRQHLPSMDDEAVEAVKRITFRPATVKGHPITLRRVPIKVPVNLEAR